jgi:hypothetical protein
MDLQLNSPAFFSTEHGIDDEIYWFFRGITKYFIDKQYSEMINTVGLIPVVAPVEILNQGLWAEYSKIKKKSRLAIISRQTDYLEYLNSDVRGKKRLMIENILSSMKSIEKKGKFDYELFEKDLMAYLELEKNVGTTM